VVQKLNVRSSERVRRRAEARRLQIVEAAGRVFRRRGFADTGMREIAAEAGLSPGNLYHYFRSKQDLLYFCQDRALEHMLAALDAARLERGPVSRQLGHVLGVHVRCLLDEVDGSAAHLELEALSPPRRCVVVAKRDRYERGIRRLVRRGVREGEFGPCDAALVTRAMLGAINWTARWFRPEGPQAPAAVAGSIVDYLLRGLRRPPRAELRRRVAQSGGGA
jgi:AcrR family transcriptional regulator